MIARLLPPFVPKLWRLLTRERRRAVAVLVGLTLAGMVLETLGIGIVVPVITILTSGDVARSEPRLSFWLDRLGFHRPEQVVVASMVAMVVIYALKALYLAFLAWRQSRFAFEIQASFSDRLFLGYLRQPWTFHLQRNSAQLLRNLTTELNNFNNVTQSLMSISTEGCVLVGITALLIGVEPLGASLVLCTLGLAAWSFNRVTRGRLQHWGELRQRHDGLRIQHIQQGLGGVKELKLLGREDGFFAEYRVHNDAVRRVGQRNVTLQQLPRLWMELLAVTGMAALVLIMMAQGRPLSALLPVLGLFAAAAFRLMPSVIRIMNSFQVVRFYSAVVDVLHDELTRVDQTKETTRGPSLPFTRDLTLDRVTFRFPSADTPVLRDLTLTIAAGSSVGIVGGSGAGKSTILDVILGLLTPESGRVAVDGVDIQSNLRGWQDQIGYVPQSIFLTDDSLRRNVAFGVPEAQIDEAAVLRAVRAANLEDFIESLPEGLGTGVGERGVQLSGGQRQRVGIARALYHNPRVLVLDEATSALDTPTERGVIEAVRALHGDKTVIIVAHRLSTVAHCDRLFRLEQGRVTEQEVMQQS